MSTSKTARASAVKTAVKEKVALTPEAAIKEIRNLRAGKLAVQNMEYVDHLLAAHDTATTELALMRDAKEKFDKDFVFVPDEKIAEMMAKCEAFDLQAAELRTFHAIATGARKLYPAEAFENYTPAQIVERVIRLLREADDVNKVTTNDLMTTIKRQEAQLIAAGIAPVKNNDLPVPVRQAGKNYDEEVTFD